MVLAKGRYGFINAAGTEIIKPAYQTAGEFSEGLAPVIIERTVRMVVGEKLLSAIEGSA